VLVEARGRRGFMCEGEVKMLVEGFAFFVELMVHGVGARVCLWV
jgi:hypothetical protein